MKAKNNCSKLGLNTFTLTKLDTEGDEIPALSSSFIFPPQGSPLIHEEKEYLLHRHGWIFTYSGKQRRIRERMTGSGNLKHKKKVFSDEESKEL